MVEQYTDGDEIMSFRTTNPGVNDVLLGRGGKINAHEGNVKFRELVSSRKPQYRTSSKVEKTKISKEIVNMVLSRGGRFLVEVSGSDVWEEVGLDRAKKEMQPGSS